MRKPSTRAAVLALVLILGLAACAYEPPPSAPYYPSQAYYRPPPAYNALNATPPPAAYVPSSPY
jgi:hypothetical protein